jgi:LacI family transcriptional regulator
MLAINHMRDLFYFDMIEAVYDVAEKHGYSLILNYTKDDELNELKLLQSLKENYVDGLILISIIFSEKHLKAMANVNCPVVLSGICNNRFKDSNPAFDYVGVDTKTGIYISTKHLINQGHTKIGYVGLPLEKQASDERYEGFCAAMIEAGLKINERYVMLGGYTENFGYNAGLTYAKFCDLPTAICASSDMAVIGLYRAFEQEGIKIPGDICIVGMDNIDIDTLIKPKISSVAIAQADIGRTAAELIFKRLNGSTSPYESIIFQPRLIVRESSIKI